MKKLNSSLILKTALLFALGTYLGSCSSAQKAGQESGSYQGQAGSSGAGDSKNGFRLRPYTETTLSNGLKVLIVEDNELPYLSLNLLIKSGSSADPEGKEGLSNYLMHMLVQSTNRHGAMEMSDRLALIGSSIQVSVDPDYTTIGASTVSSHNSELLDLFSEALLEPQFNPKDMERVRQQVLSALSQRPDQPVELANDLMESYLYSGHPYGHPSIGNSVAVKSIQKKNLIQHYLKVVRPNNSILAVVGHFNKDEMLGELEKRLQNWKARDMVPLSYSQVQDPTGTQIRVVNRSDLVQAQIRFVQKGIKRSDPDFMPLRIASSILGGGMSSRLMERVRQDLGLTYSISSSFDPRISEGPFEISTFTKNATVGKTVEETLNTLKKFVNEGVTKEEVQSAKNYLWGRFPQAIETPEHFALNLQLLRVYGVPDTYLANYKVNLDKITVEDVNRAIKKHIKSEPLKILVYSKAEDVKDQIIFFGKTEVKDLKDLGM